MTIYLTKGFEVRSNGRRMSEICCYYYLVLLSLDDVLELPFVEFIINTRILSIFVHIR